MGERPLPGHEGEAKWYVSDFSLKTPLTEMAALRMSGGILSVFIRTPRPS